MENVQNYACICPEQQSHFSKNKACRPSLTEVLGLFSHSYWSKMHIAVGKMLLAFYLHMHRLEIGFFCCRCSFPCSRQKC